MIYRWKIQPTSTKLPYKIAIIQLCSAIRAWCWRTPQTDFQVVFVHILLSTSVTVGAEEIVSSSSVLFCYSARSDKAVLFMQECSRIQSDYHIALGKKLIATLHSLLQGKGGQSNRIVKLTTIEPYYFARVLLSFLCCVSRSFTAFPVFFTCIGSEMVYIKLGIRYFKLKLKKC